MMYNYTNNKLHNKEGKNMKQKWYLQTWLIAICFALWFLILPLIVGIILLVKQYKSNNKLFNEEKTKLAEEKAEVELRAERLNMVTLEQVNEEIEIKKKELDSLICNRDAEKAKIVAECDDHVIQKEKELIALQKNLETKNKELKEIESVIENKKSEIVQLDNEILLQDFGVYAPMYDFANSEMYKDRLLVVRQKQKDMIQDDTVCSYPKNMTLDGSLSQGKKMIKDNVKQIVRSFNNECDSAIAKVKFNNIESIRKKIEKSYEQLNKMNSKLQIALKPQYLSLKLDELNLAYEYQVKKEEEKEEARRIREEQKEAQKLLKEIEAARKLIEKEQTHYANAMKSIEKQLELATDEDRPALLAKQIEIQKQLDKLEEEIKDVDYREANQKAGYVYVISNIGSFGENVYKIGMTRRLDPQDRVDELGDASVPFRFDVHAMIFAEDAPALESALHKAFDDKKVNMVNGRKEFFNVTLDEIESVVKANFDKTVEFVKIPEAEQYRESLMMKKSAV